MPAFSARVSDGYRVARLHGINGGIAIKVMILNIDTFRGFCLDFKLAIVDIDSQR
ncbi:MAG: hypothetical protein AB2697_19005 [Candidatus Thiodiazotropha endolucinida]